MCEEKNISIGQDENYTVVCEILIITFHLSYFM